MRPWTETLARKFDALGNDVTETGDFMEAKRVVDERGKLLSDLGLSEDATQAEIDAAKAKHSAEMRYEMAKETIAEFEEKHPAEGEPAEPVPPTPEETQEYNEAKAEIAAYEAAQQQAAEAPAAEH